MHVISLHLKKKRKKDCPKDTLSGINFTLLMWTREGDEPDTKSLVKHSTEGNGSHEYFMGFGFHTSIMCPS